MEQASAGCTKQHIQQCKIAVTAQESGLKKVVAVAAGFRHAAALNFTEREGGGGAAAAAAGADDDGHAPPPASNAILLR